MVLFTILGCVALLIYFYRKILLDRIFFKDSNRNEEESVAGKIVLITGSNTGIGKTSAQEMAERGANVIMACRNMDAANEAIQSIRKVTKNGTLTPMKLDLGSLESIREFSKEIHSKVDKIDILINNAGVAYPNNWERLKTSNGFEMHFGINHLGHFLMTNLILDLVKKGSNPRIVIVGSLASMLGEIDFNDLYFDKRNWEVKSKFDISPLYSNSKLANALFGYELSKRLSGIVNCYYLCPGCVRTDIGRHSLKEGGISAKFLFEFVGSLFLKSSLKGCQTIVYCAANKKIAGETGMMYKNCGRWGQVYCFPEDHFFPNLSIGNKVNAEDAKKLWEVSEKIVGLK